jgi:hypothetical protein
VTLAAAASRRVAAVLPAADDGTLCSVAGVDCAAICGQPRNETTALASTNMTAAPASREPAVPKPATYARVARIPRSVIGPSGRVL